MFFFNKCAKTLKYNLQWNLEIHENLIVLVSSSSIKKIFYADYYNTKVWVESGTCAALTI